MNKPIILSLLVCGASVLSCIHKNDSTNTTPRNEISPANGSSNEGTGSPGSSDSNTSAGSFLDRNTGGSGPSPLTK